MDTGLFFSYLLGIGAVALITILLGRVKRALLRLSRRLGCRGKT